MIKPVVDTHTHTIASIHAYSTILENLAAAKAKGLTGLAITDHAPSVIAGLPLPYFVNLVALPKEMDGMRLIIGVEANIIDFSGNIDMPESVTSTLELVIASCHGITLAPGSEADHTRAYEGVAKNPMVDIIGHCGQEAFRFDYEKGLRAFKEYGKIVEINAHSFHGRPGSTENCKTIAQLCKKLGVPIVVSSDAHFATQIGEFSAAIAMLEEIDFPKDQILNLDLDRLLSALPRRR